MGNSGWKPGVVIRIGLSVLVGLLAQWSFAVEKPKTAGGKRCEVDQALVEGGEKTEWKGACSEGKADGQGLLIWTDRGRRTRSYEGEMAAGLPQGDGTLIWANGRRYVGQFSAGRPEGKGVIHLANGDRYEGQFVAGDVQGAATYHFASGDRYVGPVADSVPQGYGVLHKGNGERYEGNFVRGVAEASVIYYFANGNRFEGALVSGQPAGKGVLHLASGGWVEGNIVNGEINGSGRYMAPSGALYDGPLSRNTPLGRGVLILPGGDRIEGDFTDAETPAGTATIHYAQGDRYEGEVAKAGGKGIVPNGRGSLHMPGGHYTQGQFADGLANGICVQSASSRGRYFEGTLVNGRRQGVGVYSWSDNSLYEGEFADGLPHGQGMLKLHDGRTYNGGFDRGVPTGQGRLELGWVAEGQFVAGILEGDAVLVMPNKARFTGGFKAGWRQGKGQLTQAGGEKTEWLFDLDAPKEDKGPHFSLFKNKGEELGGLIDDGLYGWAQRYWLANRAHFDDKPEQAGPHLGRLAKGLAAPFTWRADVAAHMASLLLADVAAGGRTVDLERAAAFLARGKEEVAKARALPAVAKAAGGFGEEDLLNSSAGELPKAGIGLLARTLAGGNLDDGLVLVNVLTRMGVTAAAEPALTAFNDFLARNPRRINAASDALNKLVEQGFQIDNNRLAASYAVMIDQALAADNLSVALEIADGADSLDIRLLTPERSSRISGLMARKTRATRSLDLTLAGLDLAKEQQVQLGSPELTAAWLDAVAGKIEGGEIGEAREGLRRAKEKGLVLNSAVSGAAMSNALMHRLDRGDVAGVLAVFGELAGDGAGGAEFLADMRKRVGFLKAGAMGGNNPFPLTVRDAGGFAVLNAEDYLDNEAEAIEQLRRYDYLVLIDFLPRYVTRRLAEHKSRESTFPDGFQEVANPEYQRVEAELASAQSELSQANQPAAVPDNWSSSGGGNRKVDQAMQIIGLLSALKGAGSSAAPDPGAAQSRVQSLQDQLSRTPRTRRETVEAGYRYEEVKVDVLQYVPATVYVIRPSRNGYLRQSLGFGQTESFVTTLGIHAKDKTANRLDRLDKVRQLERKPVSMSLVDLAGTDKTLAAGDAAGLKPLDGLPSELADGRDRSGVEIIQQIESAGVQFDKDINAIVASLHEEARGREEQVIDLLRQSSELPPGSRDGRRLGLLLSRLSAKRLGGAGK
jgi:hypothetical protein